MIMKFGHVETLEALRYIIATTLDERAMVRAWQELRKLSKAPLFLVQMNPPSNRAREARFNFVMVMAMLQSGMRPKETARVANMSFGQVYKYRRDWAAMTDTARAEHRREIERYLERAAWRSDEWFLVVTTNGRSHHNLSAVSNHFLTAAVCRRSGASLTVTPISHLLGGIYNRLWEAATAPTVPSGSAGTAGASVSALYAPHNAGGRSFMGQCRDH